MKNFTQCLRLCAALLAFCLAAGCASAKRQANDSTNDGTGMEDKSANADDSSAPKFGKYIGWDSWNLIDRWMDKDP